MAEFVHGSLLSGGVVLRKGAEYGWSFGIRDMIRRGMRMSI